MSLLIINYKNFASTNSQSPRKYLLNEKDQVNRTLKHHEMIQLFYYVTVVIKTINTLHT